MSSAAQRLFMRLSILSVLCASILLPGCAAQLQQQIQQEQSNKMAAKLNPYVGRSVADVALEHGPPTNTIDMGANKRGFQWQYTGQSAGAVVSGECCRTDQVREHHGDLTPLRSILRFRLFSGGGVCCRGRTAQLSDGGEYFPPMPERDTDVLEVLIGQMTEYGYVNLVLGKALRVLPKTELFLASPQSAARAPSPTYPCLATPTANSGQRVTPITRGQTAFLGTYPRVCFGNYLLTLWHARALAQKRTSA
jgi:hypothetical protein